MAAVLYVDAVPRVERGVQYKWCVAVCMGSRS